MSVDYLDLADFVAISAAVPGLDEDTIVKIADLGLADSALRRDGMWLQSPRRSGDFERSGKWRSGCESSETT